MVLSKQSLGCCNKASAGCLIALLFYVFVVLLLKLNLIRRTSLSDGIRKPPYWNSSLVRFPSLCRLIEAMQVVSPYCETQ